MPCGEEENFDVWEIEKGARKSLAVEQPWEKTRYTPATKTLPASKNLKSIGVSDGMGGQGR